MHLQLFLSYLLLASAQAAIGLNIVAAKYVIDKMPVFLFLGIRFLISSILLTLIAGVIRQSVISTSHPTGRLQKIDWGFLVAQALTGGFLFNFFFFWGMEYTTATAGGIISSTLPAMIAVCAYFFLGERLKSTKILAILLAISGIIVISLDTTMNADTPQARTFLGDFLVLCAMVPEALYSIFNKYIGKRFNPLSSAALVNWLIFLMLLPLAIVEYRELGQSLSFFDWIMIVVCGLCGVVFYWAWPKGLLMIPANTAAIFGGIVPVVTAILGWSFLGEDFGWYDFFGILLVFASLAIGIEWRRSVKSRDSVATIHDSSPSM